MITEMHRDSLVVFGTM